MPHAIRIHQHGGPEVLQWEAVDIGAPKPDEVLIRHTAVGLNFYDVYERTGLYQANLPLTPGREAAGIVEAVGSNIRYISAGDRVAYVANTSGAYSEQRLVPGDRVVRLPDGISDEVAAAVLLKGLTAQMLVRQLYRVRRNDHVLIHAAAGGVGSLVVSWRNMSALACSLWSAASPKSSTSKNWARIRFFSPKQTGLLPRESSARTRACTWCMTPSVKTPSCALWIACVLAA